ncbi:Cupin domain-containing protein OS=Streptomyces tendae OX=1932 GN=GUR47_29610 PE=4 SV=1 [Streptomyces tendae]
MFFQASPPPDHGATSRSCWRSSATEALPDHEAIEALRAKYYIQQLTPLRHR